MENVLQLRGNYTYLILEYLVIIFPANILTMKVLAHQIKLYNYILVPSIF